MVLLKNDRHALPLTRARAALDRRDRPVGRRRDVHHRRLGRRAAGAPGTDDHAAGRDHRAGAAPGVQVDAAQGSLGDVPAADARAERGPDAVERQRPGLLGDLLEQRRLRRRARR